MNKNSIQDMAHMKENQVFLQAMKSRGAHAVANNEGATMYLVSE